MHMQQSGMSLATADGSSSSAVVSEWRGWPKVHTSAVVIIPPDSCWPQIQDIRRFVYLLTSIYPQTVPIQIKFGMYVAVTLNSASDLSGCRTAIAAHQELSRHKNISF